MNRIKQEREKKNLTQNQFVQGLNNFLDSDNNKYKNERGVKPVTVATASRWENGLNQPTSAMWKALADFFEVSVLYLQGAYTKEEIAKIVQENYKEQYGAKTLKELFPFIYRKLQTSTVDNYFISIGVIPYDIKQESYLLKPEQVDDFSFWLKNLEKLYTRTATKWLITKPTLGASKEDVLSAVNDVMNSIISESAIEYINPWLYNHTDLTDNQYFAKRLSFLDDHLFYEHEKNPDGSPADIPYFDFDKTNHDK